MICSKCNHKLPNDSEFCQYCGNKIIPIEEAVSDAQTAEVVSDVPKVPVSPKKEETAPEEQPAKTISEEHPEPPIQAVKVVEPVVLNDTKTKKKKVRYCSRCGSLIDGQTKQCTGCGKKYFKGIRFNKIFFIVLSFTLALLVAIGFIVHQHYENERLQSQISTLKNQKSNLEKKVDKLEDEKWDNWSKLNFFDTYAEIVPSDGTNTYHKWGCSKMDDDARFRIFNTAAVEDNYKKCPYCH